MNERIEQLSTQAVNYARENFGTDFVLFYKLWQEKFAELIVRECVEVVKWTPSMFPNDEYVKNIKQHFGVEE
jgi:hypothetical protein